MRFALTLVTAALSVSIQAQEAPKAARASAIDAKISAMEKEAAPAGKKKMTRAELEMRPEVQKKTGGFVDVPAKGAAVIVVDARPKAGGAPDQFAQVFMNLSKTRVGVEKRALKAEECPIAAIKAERDATKAAFAIIVVESDKLTGLTVLPEERVVVINASKYREGADTFRHEERVLKEIWRGLGFVSGVGYAPHKNDVLQPVFTVRALDALEYQVMQPMNFQKIYTIMKEFGATRARHVPYRTAVNEGWAAAPTNDYQKAIWDQVHAMPTSPLKIKPETKKVKE